MSRPNYLPCIMTPEIIRHINQEMECYDRDPERYERQEREAKEQYEQDQAEMYNQMRREQERQEEQDYYDNIELPF